MKAIVTRIFIIEDYELKQIIKHEIPNEKYLKCHLTEMTSCELDDICDNCISNYTKVEIEE